MQQKVAKLIALNRFSAQAITNCSFIRRYFNEKGDTLPMNPHSVMGMVQSFFEKARKEAKNILQDLKQSDAKFSATLDKWKSEANHRYMNVNVHTSDDRTFNLGLIRIIKSCPANKMHKLWQEKLEEFSLSEADIFINEL